MKNLPIIALSVVVSFPAIAEETRQLDSHEHGVGQLDIAFDGSQVAMEMHAPGADIVGFEYAAESAEDLAAIETALGLLSKPLDLFAFSEAAGCSVVEAHAELESEESHDEHDDDKHEEHAHDDHDDHEDEHAEHEEKGHEGHDDDKHEEHAHDDHEEHAEEAGHTEFHAEYLLNCSNVTAIDAIEFSYFESFPNALEVEVQIITDTGATSFEVERDTPVLNLSDLF
ncbi:MAG: DUF2796 domain-containing protein [Lentilitoribacter sp.]